MQRRLLFDLSRILDEAVEYADGLRRELGALADDLNSALSPTYEVTFVHLDTVDYLAFAGDCPDTVDYLAFAGDCPDTESDGL